METLKRPLLLPIGFCIFIDLINAILNVFSMTCMSWYWCPCTRILLSLMNCNNSSVLIYTWSLLPTKLYWLLYSDWFTSYLIMALIPYYSQLLVLLNHVVIVLMYVVLRVLRKIDAYLISTPVNTSLYYYYYYVRSFVRSFQRRL